MKLSDWYLVAWLIVAVLSMVVVGAEVPADSNDGLSLWALAGDGMQEARVEYSGWLQDIGLAVGGVHRDAPDGEIEDWGLRGYLLAHALSTEMIASLAKGSWTLPDGNVYGGLFGEYTFDREKEWSGGYVLGATIDWPNRWQTVGEYQATVWNTGGNGYEFVVGLRRRF